MAEILAQIGRFDHMGGWGWANAVFVWLFMALVIVLIVWLIWTLARRPDAPAPRRSALAMLDERYAKGEIERDDYLARKSDLEA